MGHRVGTPNRRVSKTYEDTVLDFIASKGGKFVSYNPKNFNVIITQLLKGQGSLDHVDFAESGDVIRHMEKKGLISVHRNQNSAIIGMSLPTEDAIHQPEYPKSSESNKKSSHEHLIVRLVAEQAECLALRQANAELLEKLEKAGLDITALKSELAEAYELASETMGENDRLRMENQYLKRAAIINFVGQTLPKLVVLAASLRKTKSLPVYH